MDVQTRRKRSSGVRARAVEQFQVQGVGPVQSRQTGDGQMRMLVPPDAQVVPLAEDGGSAQETVVVGVAER